MHSQIRMLWILFYIEIFIPRNTCSLAWTHAGLSEEIISEANAVSLIVLPDWLLLFVLCAFGQRSGVRFQAVFRRPCVFHSMRLPNTIPFFFFWQIWFVALYKNLHWKSWELIVRRIRIPTFLIKFLHDQLDYLDQLNHCLVLKYVDTKKCLYEV